MHLNCAVKQTIKFDFLGIVLEEQQNICSYPNLSVQRA